MSTSKGASWAKPILKLDAGLTSLEALLVFGVVMLEIGSLVLWTSLSGFSVQPQPGDSRGTIIRAALFMVFGGTLAYVFARKIRKEVGSPPSKAVQQITAAALIGSALFAVATKHMGIDYARNALNWLQNASSLMLVGGLRGLVTRLTLWVALLGASLATAKGKHINVDVLMRFVPESWRKSIAVIGYLAAMLMCASGAWGFLDQLTIVEFRVERNEACADNPLKQCEISPSKKIHGLKEEVARDVFLLGKQIELDVKTLPKVILGKPYDQWMSPSEWNSWFNEGHWERYFDAEAVKTQLVPAERTEPKLPSVNIPGATEEIRGILVRDLNLVLPLGLLVIALRFLIRTILVLTGHVDVDPNAAHGGDEEEVLAHSNEDGKLEAELLKKELGDFPEPKSDEALKAEGKVKEVLS